MLPEISEAVGNGAGSFGMHVKVRTAIGAQVEYASEGGGSREERKEAHNLQMQTTPYGKFATTERNRPGASNELRQKCQTKRA